MTKNEAEAVITRGIKTETGNWICVYAYEATADRPRAIVRPSIASRATDVTITLTPPEARKYAELLLIAADCAEGKLL